MTEVAGKHAARQTKDTELNPFKLRVKLSPEMQEQLEKVISVVSSSPYIDEEVLTMARQLTAGKQNLVSALTTVRFLNEDIDKHHRIDGGEVNSQWETFIHGMSAAYEAKPPFTLVQGERHRGRR